MRQTKFIFPMSLTNILCFFVRSANLTTPHQSPTDSPISFVTPIRKTSPPRKSSGQKKPLKSATHSMTLRARSCPNKTTRCARLPNTN